MLKYILLLFNYFYFVFSHIIEFINMGIDFFVDVFDERFMIYLFVGNLCFITFFI